MEFTNKQNIKLICALLFLTVVTQVVYTGLYVVAKDVPRAWLWGLEGLVFVALIAIAGAALVETKKFTLGFAAIFASAILNFIQVGIGLTQFGPFRETAQSIEAIAPAAGSVVALSFFIYNGAKVLLGLSALVFGLAISHAGSKFIGKLTCFFGAVAIITNAVVIMFGRIDGVPSGAAGVIATLLLAICLLKLETSD